MTESHVAGNVCPAAITASQQTQKRIPAIAAKLAVGLYCGALILPFMDHSGVCIGLQVLWGVVWDSWLGVLLVLLTHGCLLASLRATSANHAPAKTVSWLLWLGLAACIALNTAWFFNYRSPFFTGFYLWLSSFLVLACALWERERFPLFERVFAVLRQTYLTWPLSGALALGCFALSWSMPATAIFNDSAMTGWQAFRNALSGSWLAWVSAATNLVAIAGLWFVLTGKRLSATASRVLWITAAGSTCVNSAWVLFFPHQLFIGFYLWLTSFCLLATIAAPKREAATAMEVPSEPRNRSMARYSLAGLLAGLLIVLPLGRASVFTLLGGTSITSAEVADASQSAPASQVTGQPSGAVPNADRQSEPNAGMNTFVGMLMGMALQREQQHYAEQRLQEQERALLRRQAREQQLQSSHVRYLPQPGGSYFGGQVGGGGGGGYRPQKFQQYEGTCTRCGMKTGRQMNQSPRTCSQITKDGDGIKPCGGVIVWAPVQGY